MVTSTIAQNAGYMSLVAGFLIFFVSLMILRIYIERKKKATIILFFSVLAWAIASFSAMIIYFQAGINLDLAIIAQKLTYACVFLGIMLTLSFASEVFIEIPKKVLNTYFAIGIAVILVMFIVESVIVKEFPDGSGWPLLNIDFVYIIATIVFIVPTVLTVLIVALKTAKKIEEQKHRIGFRIIALGQLFIILTFIADIIQGSSTDNLGLYGLFLYLTWVFPIAAITCYYLGWTMPSWFSELFDKQKGAKKNG